MGPAMQLKWRICPILVPRPFHLILQSLQTQQQQQKKRLNQRMQIYQVLKSESPGYYCK